MLTISSIGVNPWDPNLEEFVFKWIAPRHSCPLWNGVNYTNFDYLINECIWKKLEVTSIEDKVREDQLR